MHIANIDISKLLEHPGKERAVSGQLVLAPATLGDERIDFTVPFSFSVTLTNVGEGIVIRGEVGGSTALKCSRCLDVFNYDIAFALDEIALFAGDGPEDGFRVDGGDLDLTPIIYENVMVELPMRPLCRDNCSGLCAHCGKNLNAEPHIHEEVRVDERLAPLKEFYKDRND